MQIPDWCISIWFHSIQKHNRFWSVNGEHIGPWAASCGFPEGDSHSVIIILSIGLLWTTCLRQACSQHLQLSCYADNWTWMTSCLQDHSRAAQLTMEVTRVLGLQIDWGKTWLWATCSEVATDIQNVLQDILPVPLTRKHHARDLGLEMQYSGSHRVGHRRDRWEQGLARIERLQKASLTLSVKEHVLTSSVYAAMFYGSEIFPCSQDALAKVRSRAADALVGPSQSMSPAIALLLTKHDILDPEYHVTLRALRQCIAWLRAQSEQTRNDFFYLAATFTGTSASVKGPASSLSIYLERVGWQVNRMGFVQVDAFVQLHLVNDSFLLFRTFLQLAWQTDLIKQKTSRYHMFREPDISRADTIQQLGKFNDKERRRLIREIARGFQDGHQKEQWAEDTDGSCVLCGQPDTYHHRLYTCPALDDTREPFQPLIHATEEHGCNFDELLAISVHPNTQLCRTLQFREPWPVISDAFRDLAAQASSQSPLYIFTDGACTDPASPTTRYAAYACVVDLCRDDFTRQQHIQQWCATKAFPPCFQVFATARVNGEQTVNRAEASAVTVAAELGPHVHIFTDSQYARSFSSLAKSPQLPSPSYDSNLDLRLRLQQLDLNPLHVHKVRAHQEPSSTEPWWDIFCALGNQAADLAAGQTLRQLQPDWRQELDRRHDEVALQRGLFYDTCQMVLALNDSRAKAMQNRQPEEQTPVVQAPIAGPERIQHLLATWEPGEFQTLTFPDMANWNKFCAWGEQWPALFFRWLQCVKWPCEPGGPLTRETGISWVELGLSLSIFSGQLLPILRKDEQGITRLLGVMDQNDAVKHNVTLRDLATTFENLWNQLRLWEPQAFPKVSRGQTTSLQAQGFLQHTTGLGLRPSLPFGQLVVQQVQALSGKRHFNVAIQPHWCQDRTHDISNFCWKTRCDLFRDARRRASRAAVSLS